MTLSSLWKKLRKKNKGDYRQFQSCLTLAVLLVSSLILVIYSPIVQSALPTGGDSRKQLYMIAVMAVAGCSLLVFYAVRLFLRYKSREMGIFLALGTEKGRLSKALYLEMLRILGRSFLVGILGGCITAFLTGKVLEYLSGQASVGRFAFTAMGALGSLLYGIFLFLVLIGMTGSSLRHTNIIEIINEQRRQEPLKKAVTKQYLMIGILFLAAGVLGAVILPNIIAKFSHRIVSGFTNIFYLFVFWGIYRILVYSLSSHTRGKNPGKYYKNLLNYGLMKFQGASVIKNMLIITLLIMGGLFAFFYLPMKDSNFQDILNKYEAGFSFRYPLSTNEITEKEIRALAEKYEVQIENYREAEFIVVVGSGIDNEDLDDEGYLIEEYVKDYAQYECISASEYQRITGQTISVEDGTYLMIQTADAYENIFYSFDAMDQLYCTDTAGYLPMKYAGNAVCHVLLIGNGYSYNSRFVVSDRDYELLRKGLKDNMITKQVLFDTSDSPKVTEFSQAFYKEFAERASEDMKIMEYYDPVTFGWKKSADPSDYPAIFDADNPVAEADWQYQPVMAAYQNATYKLTYAISYLLFIYLSLICLIAVSIIAYTRSISVAISSRQVFGDIAKLGADHTYLCKLLKYQLKKVYVLPTIIGCAGMVCFEILILWQNDGVLRAYELRILPILFLTAALVSLCQYFIYRFSLARTKRILHI
ncbi:MAG: hypothetical protein Q4D16_06275 [Eubacteriales bacterium]|nr:hypothetical protein [Eubacteriales bacterium]